MESVALTTELATEIAAETSRIIGYSVLITDESGLVIGSGDTERIGTLHAPSLHVAATGETSSKERSEIRDPGVRPGITMPLTIDGATVGTVGIAGPPKVLRRFGQLVQRQTEILLRESLSQRTRVLHEGAVAQLVRDIEIYDERLLDAAVVTLRAEELGYDLSGERVAVTVEVIDDGRRRRPLLRAHSVREVFSHREDIVAERATERYVVLRRVVAPEQSHTSPRQEVLQQCHAAAAALRQRHGVHVRLGVGSIASGIAALSLSCADAVAALRIARQRRLTTDVVDISSVRLQQLFEAVPAATRSRFVDSQLAMLQPDADYADLRATLIAWCESGFNLVRAAGMLSIHRNTVIYRLDKISRLTTHDMRRPQEAFPLYVASLITELHKSTE